MTTQQIEIERVECIKDMFGESAIELQIEEKDISIVYCIKKDQHPDEVEVFGWRRQRTEYWKKFRGNKEVYQYWEPCLAFEVFNSVEEMHEAIRSGKIYREFWCDHEIWITLKNND